MSVAECYGNRIAVHTYRLLYRRLGINNMTSVFRRFEGTEYPTVP